LFVTMVFHHPRPEHVGAFTQFMATIEAGMDGTDGLVSLESYADPQAARLVAIGRWESAEHAAAGVPKLMSIGGRQPEWTDQPDEVFRLVQL
jgi:quinol monooxygenase YgiN